MQIPFLSNIQDAIWNYIFPGDMFRQEKKDAVLALVEAINDFHYMIFFELNGNEQLIDLFLTEVNTESQKAKYQEIWNRPLLIEMAMPGEVIIEAYYNNIMLPKSIRKALKPLIIDWNQTTLLPEPENAVFVRVAPISSPGNGWRTNLTTYSTFGTFYDELFSLKKRICEFLRGQGNLCQED